MIKYLNTLNGLIYWVQGNRVVCAEKHDLSDYIPSSFTVEEFKESLELSTLFEKV